jgi:hypothetical protein
MCSERTRSPSSASRSALVICNLLQTLEWCQRTQPKAIGRTHTVVVKIGVCRRQGAKLCSGPQTTCIVTCSPCWVLMLSLSNIIVVFVSRGRIRDAPTARSDVGVAATQNAHRISNIEYIDDGKTFFAFAAMVVVVECVGLLKHDT